MCSYIYKGTAIIYLLYLYKELIYLCKFSESVKFVAGCLKDLSSTPNF